MDYTVTIQEEAEKITHAVFHKSVEIVEGQYGHYIYKKDEMIYIPCGGAVYVKNAITEVETCKQYFNTVFRQWGWEEEDNSLPKRRLGGK